MGSRVCKRRVKCAGLNSKGQLKKGYRFQKGTGKVIKASKKK